MKIKTKSSFSKKLALAMVLVATLPVLIVTALTTWDVYNDSREQMLSENTIQMAWVSQYMDDVISQFSDILFSVEMNPNFKEDISTWDLSTGRLKIESQNNLQDQLHNVVNSDQRINAMEIYMQPSGRVMKVDYSQTSIHDSVIPNEYLWNHDIELSNNYLKNDNNTICMIRKLRRFEDRKWIGSILLRFDDSVVEDLTNILISQSNESYYLINDQGEVVFSYPETIEVQSEKTVYFNELKQKELLYEEHEGNYYFLSSITDSRFFLVKAVPIEEIINAPIENMKWGLGIGVLSLLISLFVTILLSRYFSKPIIRLANEMATQPIDLIINPLNGNPADEVGILRQGIDTMIKRIELLNNEEYRRKIELREAQLTALQAQINPHFLHNTLQLIGGISLARDSMDVYKTTLALSSILRYSMDNNEELVTIREETQYLESYLDIQNLRFDGRFTFDNNIPKELEGYRIPKLIMQPIVENSFTHGFEGSKDPTMDNWHIALNGFKKNDYIVLEITDNGTGMDAEDVKHLQDLMINNKITSFGDGKHIGLLNVDARLKLYFDPTCGIEIIRESKGLTVQFKLKSTKEMKNNDL